MSPEILTNSAASPASDIYAFGIMLYEMVTSSQAYKGLRYAQVINMVLVQQIRPPWPAHAMPDLGKLYL
ncbi:protein kinase domain-containing protein, partial [Haematococcus lacustris]